MTCKENAIRRIKARISRSGTDGLLVNDRHNIMYLTGFYSAGAMLLIEKKGHPVYFIDTMNSALVEEKLSGLDLRIVTASGSSIKAVSACVRAKGLKKIGFNSEALSVLEYNRLSKLIPKVRLVPEWKGKAVSSALKGIRKIKSREEIALLRAAGRETVRIWREVRKHISFGMSEKEIATLVDTCICRRGYEKAFPTIAASGRNTAYPHAVPTDKRLHRDEHLLVDFGIRYHGYCSDLTRIWYKGRINRQIRDFREYVQKSHDLAVKEIKPGAKIGSVVSRANNVFRMNGLGDLVLHGLGHGIGVDVHEEPFLREGCRKKFQKGMVVTVEPGIYRTGFGGVRIEDMVLVTGRGCEVLTV